MIKTEAYLKNGKLFTPYLHLQKTHALEDKKLQLTIEEYPENVSANQHGYYRKLNSWLAENTNCFSGWHTDRIHDFARSLFLFESATFSIVRPGGEIEIIESRNLISTADCGKKRMSQFITQWRDYLLYELDIETPEAEDFSVPPVTQLTDVYNIDDKL